MRGLTKKQRKILDRFFEQHKEELTYNMTIFDINDDVYDSLVEINDYETINADILNYLYDKISENMGG